MVLTFELLARSGVVAIEHSFALRRGIGSAEHESGVRTAAYDGDEHQIEA